MCSIVVVEIKLMESLQEWLTFNHFCFFAMRDLNFSQQPLLYTITGSGFVFKTKLKDKPQSP